MQGDTKWGFSLPRNVSMWGWKHWLNFEHGICGLMAVYFKGFDYTKKRRRRWKLWVCVLNVVGESIIFLVFDINSHDLDHLD